VEERARNANLCSKCFALALELLLDGGDNHRFNGMHLYPIECSADRLITEIGVHGIYHSWTSTSALLSCDNASDHVCVPVALMLEEVV